MEQNRMQQLFGAFPRVRILCKGTPAPSGRDTLRFSTRALMLGLAPDIPAEYARN